MILKNISKSFGNKEIIHDFSLEIPKKSIICITGPSGCGKTTLLNIIAGLETADSGSVSTDGRVSYLFQEPRLLPWKTVLENVEIVCGKDSLKAKKMLKAAGLDNDLDKYPYELSGGMKQRVAICRAFCFESDTILMDEPFQNLDDDIKAALIKTFTEIWKKTKKTVIWVTHDTNEVSAIADKIVRVDGNGMRIRSSRTVNR